MAAIIRVLAVSSMASCLLLLASGCSGSPDLVGKDQLAQDPPTQVRCLLAPAELDFGLVFSGDTNERLVQIKNTGATPLSILSAKSTCGCIAVEVGEKEVAPQSSADVRIWLALENYSPEAVDGSVILETNDPATPRQEITVTAKLQPELVVEPGMLDFGRVRRGQAYSQTLLVRQNGRRKLEITGVDSSPGITATCKAVETPDAAEDSPKAYEIDVTLEPALEKGTFSGRLTLFTNIARASKLPVEVRAEFVGIEYSITPSLFVFGPISPGADAGLITVTGAGALEIARAESTIPDLQTGVFPVEPGRIYEIRFTAAESANVGTKVGKLLLELREGQLSETCSVNIYGRVARVAESKATD